MASDLSELNIDNYKRRYKARLFGTILGWCIWQAMRLIAFIIGVIAALWAYNKFF